jgi:hypothetical protein
MISDNMQHPPASGDLLGDSVENMRGECNEQEVRPELTPDLALEHPTKAATARPRAPPRRSSRIAEKKVSRVIR